MLNVIEDEYTGADHNWKYTFSDGSSVVVKEIYATSPPHLKKVSGDFTSEQVEAIVRYGRLEVRD